MKFKIARICFLFALLLLPLAPARADHDDGRRYVKRSFEAVQDDYHDVLKLRDNYGASRHMEEEFADARYLYARIRQQFELRDPPYGRIGEDVHRLRQLVDHLRDEYRDLRSAHYGNRRRVIEERTTRTYRWW